MDLQKLHSPTSYDEVQGGPQLTVRFYPHCMTIVALCHVISTIDPAGGAHRRTCFPSDVGLPKKTSWKLWQVTIFKYDQMRMRRWTQENVNLPSKNWFVTKKLIVALPVFGSSWSGKIGHIVLASTGGEPVMASASSGDQKWMAMAHECR